MGYPEDLTEIKGIGLGTAARIAEVYPNREDLATALDDGSFVFANRLVDPLRSALNFQSLDEEPEEIETPEPEAPQPEPKKARKKKRPRIRSTLRQSLDIYHGTSCFSVPTRFVEVPKEHIALYESSHFRDLCLMGHVLLEPTPES